MEKKGIKRSLPVFREATTFSYHDARFIRQYPAVYFDNRLLNNNNNKKKRFKLAN